MLLTYANQFNEINGARHLWLNTIAQAAIILWKPVTKLPIKKEVSSDFAINGIVHIAKILWKLTTDQRKTQPDYNSLAQNGYNKAYCSTIAGGEVDYEILQQKLDRLASEKTKNTSHDDDYNPDIPLNFIIAAANVYLFAFSIMEFTFSFSGLTEKLLPEITQCSLEFIHNSVQCPPLTLTDVRIIKYYENKNNPTTASDKIFDYIYNLVEHESPNVDYIFKDYGTEFLELAVPNKSFNNMLVDPMGMFKMSIYSLIASPLKRLVNYPVEENVYQYALTAYNIIDKHFTNVTERKTFYTQLLLLVGQKSSETNQIAYNYDLFDKTCINSGEKISLYSGYDNILCNNVLNVANSQHFITKTASNQPQLWTNIKKLVRILNPEFLATIFDMPYNMWSTILDSNSDDVDEALGKLELALYNVAALYNLLSLNERSSVPTPFFFSSPFRNYKINSFRSFINPVFRRSEIKIYNNSLIISKLSLKIWEYYNLFSSDDHKHEKNRLKLVKQLNRVLEWLESYIEDYNKTKDKTILQTMLH